MIAIVAVFFVGLEAFRRYVVVTKFDKNAFQKYELTAEVKDIAEKITLTDKAKEFFWKLEPRFISAADFIKFCQTVARGIEALACLAPKPYGGPFAGHAILLLQMDDPRFINHKYSAAAHELLHYAYRQLSAEEKERLNSLLDQEWAKHEAEPHLQAAIGELKRLEEEEEEIFSELHSKFAVEYAEISPELEQYYKQYFNDRQAVVDWFVKGGFGSRVRHLDELTQQAKALEKQLKAIDPQQSPEALEKYNRLVEQYNAKAAESQKTYQEIQEFHSLFNPDYQPPEKQK